MKTYILPAALLATFFVHMGSAQAIPAYARAYDVSCSTCHTAIPRRNEFGEAFRMLGYRWPKVGGADAAEKTPETRLTSQEMRGNSLFESLFPADIPLSLVASGQALITGRNSSPKAEAGFQYLYLRLLGGGALSDHISWNASADLVTALGGPNVLEAYFHLSQLADRPELNVRVGYLEPWTVTYKSNNQILTDFYFVAGTPVANSRFGAELNGIIAERGFYAVSVLRNGATSPYTNVAYRASYRLGGANLMGEDLTVDVENKRWWESLSVTVAHWGFFGRNQTVLPAGLVAIPGAPTLTGPSLTDLRRYGIDLLINYENVAQVYASLMLGADAVPNATAASATSTPVTLPAGFPAGLPAVPAMPTKINSTILLVEALYSFTPWLSGIYLYQYNSTTAQAVEQHHSLGLNLLPVENIRATLRGTLASNDAFTGDRAIELQLYIAL